MTGNMKNASKFLKAKCDFNIANDEGDGEGSIKTMNKTDTFVELKNKHWANFLIDIEKTIKSNSCERRAKVTLVSKIAGSTGSVRPREPALKVKRTDE
ncbi:hypothetical protein Tco_0336084 [Tanacetum coccineum]